MTTIAILILAGVMSMHRIDTATRAVDLFGAGKDGYTEGDPGLNIPATRTTDDHFNAFQEELCSVIEGQGMTLEKADNTQVLTAIQKAIDAAMGEIRWANWTKVLLPGTDPIGRAQDYGGNYNSMDGYFWCVVGEQTGDAFIATSTDGGETWTEQNAGGGFTGVLRAVGFAGAGAVVAVGDAGEIQKSDDGITWAHKANGGGYAGDLTAVFHSGSLWVAVGTAGEIQSSADGSTWFHRSTGGGYAGWLRGIVKGGSLWVAVGNSGEIQTSPDGATWTHRSPANSYSGDFYAITYADGLYISVGSFGEVQTSPDGTTWTRRSHSSYGPDTFYDVHAAGTFIIASGAAYGTYGSLDGTTWELQGPGGNFINAVAGSGWLRLRGDAYAYFMLK